MKKTPSFISFGMLITLILFACSKNQETAVPGEGSASPEEVFAVMKGRPYGDVLPLLTPDEVFKAAYQNAIMCRGVVAFQRDPDERKAAEEAFEALIAKYELADRLEFTDPESEEILEVARRSFEGVDCQSFVDDCSQFMDSHYPSDRGQDEEVADIPDKEKPTYVSMKDLVIEDDWATATVVLSSSTEEAAVFVRTEAGWFYSLEQAMHAGPDASMPQKVVILFDSKQSMEDATAKKILAGVNYDRSSLPSLKKYPAARGGYLEFFMPLYMDDPEEDSDNAIAAINGIEGEILKVPGVVAILEDTECLEMYELLAEIEDGPVDRKKLAQWLKALKMMFISFDLKYNSTPYDGLASRVREGTGSPLSLAGGNVLNQLMAITQVPRPLPIPQLSGSQGDWIYSPGEQDHIFGLYHEPVMVSPVFEGVCLVLGEDRAVKEISAAERETFIDTLKGAVVVRGPLDQEPPSIKLDSGEFKAAFDRTMKADLDDPKVLAEILQNAVDFYHLRLREAHDKEGYLDVYCSPETGKPCSGWVTQISGAHIGLFCYEKGLPNGPMLSWHGARVAQNQIARGPKSSQGQMLMGLRTGVYASFYPNGKRKTEADYGDHGGVESATVRKPNGELCTESGLDGNGDGVIVSYRPDGSVEERHHHKGGWITKVEKVADEAQKSPPKAVPTSWSLSEARSDTELPISTISASSEIDPGKSSPASQLLKYDDSPAIWNSGRKAAEETLSMELEKESSVSGAIIRWKAKNGYAGARALHYTIETSIDGSSWELAHVHDETNPNKAEDSVSFKSTRAKHVRIRMTHSSYGNKKVEGEGRPSNFTMCWLKIFGEDPDGAGRSGKDPHEPSD